MAPPGYTGLARGRAHGYWVGVHISATNGHAEMPGCGALSQRRLMRREVQAVKGEGAPGTVPGVDQLAAARSPSSHPRLPCLESCSSGPSYKSPAGF